MKHVWWHYAWTGDLQSVQDLWPNVCKAVAWQFVEADAYLFDNVEWYRMETSQ